MFCYALCSASRLLKFLETWRLSNFKMRPNESVSKREVKCLVTWKSIGNWQRWDQRCHFHPEDHCYRWLWLAIIALNSWRSKTQRIIKEPKPSNVMAMSGLDLWLCLLTHEIKQKLTKILRESYCKRNQWSLWLFIYATPRSWRLHQEK